MATPLRDLPDYLRVFVDYLGRRIYLIFIFAIMATLAEGVGIMMFLPLFQILSTDDLPHLDSNASGSLSELSSNIYKALNYLGITSSTTAILSAIIFAFLAKAALQLFSEGYTSYLTALLLQSLKNRMFDNFSRMTYGYYTERDTGYFVNIINVQISQMLSVFSSLLRIGVQITSVMVYMALALMTAWHFGVMAIVIGGILMLLINRWNERVRILSRKVATENGHLAKLLIQSLQAFKYLTATDQMKHLRAAIKKAVASLTAHQIRLNYIGVVTRSVREPIVVVSVVAIIIIQVNYLKQPLSPIIVSIMLFYRSLNALLLLQATFQSTMSNVGSLELVQEEFNNQARHKELDGSLSVSELKESIQISGVTYTYVKSESPSLQNIDITIPALSTVAFIGESGAGKSTLVDLITLVIKPQRGSVIIDGIHHDQIKLNSWRNQIGYVSQETVLFDDTVANNISMWGGNIDDDPLLLARVCGAAREAHIHDFIQALPEGYSTRVGDRGVRLSGGQRQRLFIARELFRKTKLLILDEATSALDSETEQAIQDSILTLKGHVTLILIAHRLNTIRNADFVYILKEGYVVESGRYGELRERDDSLLNSMISLQEG